MRVYLNKEQIAHIESSLYYGTRNMEEWWNREENARHGEMREQRLKEHRKLTNGVKARLNRAKEAEYRKEESQIDSVK